MKTSRKLALLATLYLSQGLPFGFFSQALPILMRQEGRSLPDIGKATWLMIPWALKFLWAPLVDRVHAPSLGRRRSWILPLQALSIALVVILTWAGKGAPISTLMAALFLTNLISATQDIATDGLAVELLSDNERGYGNSVQVAGYRAGMILGGGALLATYDKLGPEATFLAMAALLALASAPIALHREPPRAPSPSAPPPGIGAWAAVMRRPGMGTWLLVLVVYKGGEALAYGMVKPLFVDRRFTMSEIGLLLGTIGFLAGLVGAVAGGALVTRLGRRRALLIAGALQVVGILTYVAPAAGLGGGHALAAASVVEHLTGGIATVSLFTIMMDACGEDAGTEYTLQASVVVIATGLAQALSGVVAARLGYAGHFLASAGLSLLGLLFTWRALAKGGVPPVASSSPHPA
jgi:MFS transporter, PAT family, beta-lactamase induction signal transducer AmpG